MKIIRYTLLDNGKIPSNVLDGGYFIKYNGGNSPQDNDIIGLSLEWLGLEEYDTKVKLENYIKSFVSDDIDYITGEPILVQNLIDNFWNKSII